MMKKTCSTHVARYRASENTPNNISTHAGIVLFIYNKIICKYYYNNIILQWRRSGIASPKTCYTCCMDFTLEMLNRLATAIHFTLYMVFLLVGARSVSVL